MQSSPVFWFSTSDHVQWSLLYSGSKPPTMFSGAFCILVFNLRPCLVGPPVFWFSTSDHVQWGLLYSGFQPPTIFSRASCILVFNLRPFLVGPSVFWFSTSDHVQLGLLSDIAAASEKAVPGTFPAFPHSLYTNTKTVHNYRDFSNIVNSY